MFVTYFCLRDIENFPCTIVYSWQVKPTNSLCYCRCWPLSWFDCSSGDSVKIGAQTVISPATYNNNEALQEITAPFIAACDIFSILPSMHAVRKLYIIFYKKVHCTLSNILFYFNGFFCQCCSSAAISDCTSLLLNTNTRLSLSFLPFCSPFLL